MNNKLTRLIVALSVLALPALVQAQFTYTTNNGAITITDYTGGGGAVAIPATINGYPVTSIGLYAFGSSGITSVTIPNSVISIGHDAFYDCSSLTSINVDAANPAYSSLGGVLFDKAQASLLQFPTGLRGSYPIPDSVTSIADDAFLFSSLTSVTIGNSVTNIGNDAFNECSSLTSLTIGNSVTSIGDGAFYECTSLTGVTIPSSVTSIGDGAFAQCKRLTSVTIPNSVTSIGDSAFYGCTSLTNVAVPSSVTSIGESAFSGCGGLTGVTIPNSVTNIGDYAFFECFSLTGVTIPSSVTSIGQGAFDQCERLTSVTIPSSVTSIGDYAFAATSLTSVYFTGNAPSPTNDSTVFDGSPTTVYYLPGTTGWGPTFDGQPTALWFLPNPLILDNGASFGVQQGGFGLTISWATNASVVVEAATNLANPVWIPVSTNTLTGGTGYFSDPQWTNYPSRYYRLSMP